MQKLSVQSLPAPPLTSVGVRAVFQPVVDLRTRAVVGFEALARGLPGTGLERPADLFAAARDSGRLGELELACQRAAVDGAEEAGLRDPLGLFLNVEPEVIGHVTRPATLQVWERACGRGPVVVELTERALTAHPAELLRGVERLRDLGCLIALDDVGADDRSLALMPLLRPDVIKLDLRLIHDRPNDRIAEVVHAVSAEAERSGARIVAEGIETDQHLETALAFGATLGQGFRFGRPGSLDRPATPGAASLMARRPQRSAEATPFDLVTGRGVRPRTARKRLLVSIASRLEVQAASLGTSVVLLASFEHRRHFIEPARSRYERVGAMAAFVAVFAEGIDAHPAPGVRGQPLNPDEPLRHAWDVCLISPHFAAAMVARDRGDTGLPDRDRRFDLAVTYDRELAVAAARLLMARIETTTPEGRG